MRRWLVSQVAYLYRGQRSYVDEGWLCYRPTGRLYWTRLRIPVTRRFAGRIVAWARRAEGLSA